VWEILEDPEEAAALFREHFGDRPPTAEEGMVLALKFDGKIVGIAALQKVMHLEPVWVHREHRSFYAIAQLARTARELCSKERGLACYVTDSKLANLLRLFGMEEMHNWRVFRWKRRADG
jgi:hypothetical protein